jgi:membrane associated rhomboid family serine protease
LILLDTDTSNVDVIAHAGGFVAGIVSMTLIYFYNKFKQRKLKKEE